MKHVLIYSDGGCDGNPGPGGWAAILRYGPRTREISGGQTATTNNRMELTAAIEALRALKEPCRVTFFTDSEYLRKGISQWVKRWKARNWKTLEKTPVKNQELWRQLDALASEHQVAWHWLKAHAGHPQNERCDRLARREIEHIKKKFTRAQLASFLDQFRARSGPENSAGPGMSGF